MNVFYLNGISLHDSLISSYWHKREEPSGSVVETWDQRVSYLRHTRGTMLSKTLFPLLGTGSTQEDRKMWQHD